jgi:hypothetical protein
MPDYKFWCFVQGDESQTLFPVITSSGVSINQLKVLIMQKKKNILQGLDAASLTLWKVGYF